MTRPEPSPRRTRRPCRVRSGVRQRRRGLSAAWLILFAPIFLIVLYFAVEIGNMWVVRGELETACEAAALAAVREWRDDPADTLTPRTVAIAYAAANPAGSQTVVLDDNYLEEADVNDNESCLGEIVLGGIEGTGCDDWIFDHDSPPGGISGTTVSLSIRIETEQDTYKDIENQDNAPFRIFAFSSNNANLVIDSVSFDVGTVPPDPNPGPNDPAGFFDLRDVNPGNANDGRNGLPPVPPPPTSPVPSGVVGHVFWPDFPDATPTAYQVTFTGSGSNAFQPNVITPPGDPPGPAPNDSFSFGVDSDWIFPPHGGGQTSNYVDWGGDFAGATVRVTFRDTVSGDTGSLQGQMQFVSDHVSILNFTDEELMGGNFGVRVQKQFYFDPLCGRLFGIPATQFRVRAEVTAMCEGSAGRPKLIRVHTYVCP